MERFVRGMETAPLPSRAALGVSRVMSKKASRRRRRKGGGGGSFAPVMTMTLAPGSVPSDEQLEAEAAALEQEIQGKYDLAKKDDLNLAALQRMSGEELIKVAKKEKLNEALSLPKQKLVFEILKARAQKQGLMMAEGTLEVMPDGFGFLRSPEYSYLPCADDVYVSPS